MRFDDCFVGVTFPQVPVTQLIIIRCFESPATTFHLVKSIRLTANLSYESPNIQFFSKCFLYFRTESTALTLKLRRNRRKYKVTIRIKRDSY